MTSRRLLPSSRTLCSLTSTACLLCLMTMPQALAAQEELRATTQWQSYDRPQLSIMAGLIQPVLLAGGNVEVDVHYKRLVVGYSHGFNLNLEGATVVGEASEQKLSMRLPFSTGLGIGFRVFEWLDVRAEGKVHRYEVREANSDNVSFDYTTVTLGAGVYIRYRPFYHFGLQDSTPEWTHGFVMTPSVRFWPNVWTSLEDDQIAYDNASTGSREIHQAQNVGFANTPFLGNLGIGYMFTF